jgi:hypothetical protein
LINSLEFAIKVNATIDSEYAKMLIPTQLPSSSLVSVASTTIPDLIPVGSHLDSELPVIEMDQRGFEREAFIEQRFHYLNDYGSLDYVYDSVSSWVEGQNQYISMIGAHARYWESADLAR